MATGNGSKNEDKGVFESDVVEKTEGTAAPEDLDDGQETGQEVVRVRQEVLDKLDLAARKLQKKFGVNRDMAYLLVAEKNRRTDASLQTETTTDSQKINTGIEIESAEIKRIEEQKRDLIACLAPLAESPESSKKIKLRLQSHALYRDIGAWLDVSEAEEYRGVKLDKEMILGNLNDIIRTVWNKHAKELRLVELGPGTGDKIKEIVLKLLNQIRLGKLNNLGQNKLKHIDLELVDVSSDMLHLTFISILRTIKNQLQKLQAHKLGDDHPWKDFVEFVELHDKKFTTNEDFANYKVDKSFYAFLSNKLKRHDGEPVESIFKYALARYFGFKKVDSELLNWLDSGLQLPLDIKPISATFQSLDGKDFHSTKEKPTLFSHLGDEICNLFPGITIQEEYVKLLGKATPFNKRSHETDVKNGIVNEGNIDAPYIAFSFQTGSLEHPNATPEEIQADADKIMPAYDNPEFNHFVSHLFKNSELSTFADSKTGKILEVHEDCYDVVANYGEDPDHPGFYGTTHHLVFNRNVDISITISYVEDNVIKEETQIFKVLKGQEVFLLPSYKPPVTQMEQLCDENDIKVVDVYQDYNETNAVFIIRAKTDIEKAWDRKLKREQEEEGKMNQLDKDAKSPTSDNQNVAAIRSHIRDGFGRFAKAEQQQRVA